MTKKIDCYLSWQSLLSSDECEIKQYNYPVMRGLLKRRKQGHNQTSGEKALKNE